MMSDTYDQVTEPQARRRVLEDLRARLETISNTLSNFKVDADEPREDANELDAVVHRIRELADVSTRADS
jgi:hypothetical protein